MSFKNGERGAFLTFNGRSIPREGLATEGLIPSEASLSCRYLLQRLVRRLEPPPRRIRVEELREVRLGNTIPKFGSKDEYLKMNSKTYWEAMKGGPLSARSFEDKLGGEYLCFVLDYSDMFFDKLYK